ncbi:hypothetical protein PPERSA_09349 [Pseudocohnilembus persalinus]|uniref:Uncharacterized protein n=1 Tax=Pseudocohnilembus persalinus TaxID=266149 RepID=A0A0V0QXR6_PSEPJ|nr:hypothetical protein PPERSA_09349 [Pseudocohnilembus persalinus]|eukprot:KRX07135.1 hypothetical protein PPERSA_09349 [Pseudocohnilembus persalinus]
MIIPHIEINITQIFDIFSNLQMARSQQFFPYLQRLFQAIFRFRCNSSVALAQLGYQSGLVYVVKFTVNKFLKILYYLTFLQPLHSPFARQAFPMFSSNYAYSEVSSPL